MPRILYIDDDDGLRLLIRRAMRRRDFDMETAASAEEGIARLTAEPFDLVAVDHYMPGKDGLETMALIAAFANPPPIVYVTGSEESRVAVAALKAGAADYVVKTIGEDFFDLLASSFRQVLERAHLVRDKARAEADLRLSNERLAALLKEANHRVANSLQIVSALVRMQASSATGEEARAALRDTQQRITAIAQVHKRLYSSGEIDTVDLPDYLSTLLSEVETTWIAPGAPGRLRFEIAPIRLATDKAVSVGVIVTELVSNAFKYAYREDEPGEIRVSLLADGEQTFVLQVEDDGCGYTAGEGPKGTGTGSKLVRIMAQSLGSDIAIEHGERGVRARLHAAI
ncbi:sensor histidine kinase [Aureimonas pseudogalii]|uniref:histidine kinase n=1 Tax=Aureimonas pseudogalii TaxID=1744844 RepID=A0A7W6H6E6_9HYPH|nr:histidine kinase dimerization/phosphoacceptor domain -containing protein [Aureimonas pseudogalii]MBB3999386.1 two-component sensor histidine kinase [Aureimonas pseudogalii]